jgi:hypothetical protein
LFISKKIYYFTFKITNKMIKKVLILTAVLLIGVGIFAFQEKEKIFTLKLNESQLNTLWYSLDKSNAEHQVVKELQSIIQSQVSQQISDTTKPKK